MDRYHVVCASGTLRSTLPATGEITHFAHRWTDAGVDVAASFTGAHVLHLAVAACVLNDLHREASKLGLPLSGVRVAAEGGFDEDWSSTGIEYRVRVDSPAPAAEIQNLVAIVEQLAEIPRALSSGTSVTRVD